MKQVLVTLSYLIFWGWNLTFLTLVYLGILPYIAIPLTIAVFRGEIETEFLITILGLILCPTISTFIGAKYLAKKPFELMRLFYGVEAPLFLLLFLRLFILRELTPASYLLLGTVLVCIIAFLGEILAGFLSNKPLLSHLQLAAHSLMILIGIYEGVLILFYAVPSAGSFLQAFLSFQWLKDLWWQITNYPESIFTWIPLSLFFICLTCTLFLGMPSSITALYIHSGQRIIRAFNQAYGKTRTTQIIAGVLTTWLVVFIAFCQQPQVKAFALLNQPATTPQQRQELLAKSNLIRQGLTNAYLASYRYLSSAEDSNQIKAMYKDIFSLPEPLTNWLQTSHNLLVAPFLYQGSSSDSEKAVKLYANFFDTSLQKGEKTAVQKALQSTAMIDAAKAGVLNINQQKVWLKEQHLNVKEKGNFAEIELYEVYENQTLEVEEIFYSFSLPESAVITGLWLGDSNDLAKRFPFQIATRGAAQEVYNSQVQRFRPIDPALLEKVGPRQYRLRAFPIPEKIQSWENNPDRPTQMHLWLTYQVMQKDGSWPLPQLTEQRNIFWTKETKRFRNNQEIQLAENSWLETSLPATKQNPQLQEVTLEDYLITAQPLTSQDYILPSGKRFAFVVDTSLSMGKHREALTATFQWLDQEILPKNKADLYLISADGIASQKVTSLKQFQSDNYTFYGTLQIKEMLRKLSQIKENNAYDAIILITDEGSYELSDDSQNIPKITNPLWLIHLVSLAPAYDDVTIKTIQDSQGGVSQDVQEVFQRLATREKLDQNVVNLVDGYAWSVTPKNPEKAVNNSDFEPLAARVLIEGLSHHIQPGSLTELDRLHAIAKKYEIVTPYSSMIVLVNDDQRQALKEAEAKSDRFDREVEDGNENLDKPNNPVNVPEPSMIIGVIISMIMWFIFRQQVNQRKSKILITK